VLEGSVGLALGVPGQVHLAISADDAPVGSDQDRSIEAARAYWGFSWAILGYTQYRSLTLIQIADVTGVYGLSFLMALSSYVCAEMLFVLCQRPRSPVALRGFPWAPLAGVTVAVVSVWLYGVIRLEQYQHLPQFSAPPVNVALVRSQTLGPQRWQPEHYARTLLHYVSATRPGITQQKTELVVWPEFALGFPLNQTSLLRAQLSSFVQTSQAFLLLGAPRVEESVAGNHYYNSAYLLAPSGALVDVYDKIRLVPFAERRPFALPEFPLPNNGAPYEFTAGQRSTTFPLPQGAFGVVICYEATYPYLARRLVQNDAQFLVVITHGFAGSQTEGSAAP